MRPAFGSRSWSALPLSALAPDRSLLTVLGKGGKERMVPIGRAARAALEAYLGVRERFLGRRAKASAYPLSVARSRRPPDPPAPDPAAEGAGAGRPASIRRGSRRMCCGTRSPAICSPAAPTCARCR